MENAQGEQESLRQEMERSVSGVQRIHLDRDKAIAELEKFKEELERSQATLGKSQLQQDKLQNSLDKAQNEVDHLQERLDKSIAEIRRVSFFLYTQNKNTFSNNFLFPVPTRKRKGYLRFRKYSITT